jgi:hypothetical protein
VADLVGIGADAVEAQRRDQGDQAWVGRIRLSAVYGHQPSHVRAACALSDEGDRSKNRLLA